VSQIDLSKLNLTQTARLYAVLTGAGQVEQAKAVAAAGELISATEWVRRVDEVKAAIEQARRYYVWDVP
jgi:hypothetical protein